ncbi:MAG: ribosome small subunit-dependent GTPase A [Cyanobacteria bacterium]|nr:ribosome small subunit-dependent GTPase A [Cyanobacteria bacterium bin.51]
MVISGLVVALQANFCQVQLDLPGPGAIKRLLCIRRTRLGKTGLQVCVGDRVELDGIDWPAGRGAIAHVRPRHSLLTRPAVANCDRVVIVAALAEPDLDPLQLSRFLLSAEATGQAVELVFSKADLLAPEAVLAWTHRAAGWGYRALSVSLASGKGLVALRRQLARPGLAVLCGPSGVGKSSLLNALIPALSLRVAAVSGKLQRGRHTTRHVELFPLGPGALLADTPGFNRPELPADPTRLAALFPELAPALAEGGCRYSNCLHQGDPGCRVGTDWDRFAIYRQCLQELGESRTPSPSRQPEGKRPELRIDRRRESSRRRLSQQGEAQERDRDATPTELIPPAPAG